MQFGAKNKNRFRDSRLAIEWVKNRATYVVLQVFGGFTGIRTPFRSFQNIKPRCRSHPACSKLFGPPKRQGPIFHNSQNDQDFPVSSQTTTTRQGSPRHQRRRHGERRRLGWNNGHQKPEGEREGDDEGQRVGCGGRQGGSEGPRRHGFSRFTSACLLEQARVCVEAFENLIKA